MTDEAVPESSPAETGSMGAQLRLAREARGLSLDHVARETRIALRNLQALEEGNYAALPGRTYVLGFGRTYARQVGLDAEQVASGLRAELDMSADPAPRQTTFEPGDPARVPSSGLVWIVAVVVLLVLAGGFFALRSLFTPGAELPSLIVQEDAARARQAAAAAAAARQAQAVPAADGAVAFTALEDGIWVKFYDGNGQQLLQKLMAKGESYTLPADVPAPQLWTGRPEALSITIGGKPVPPLANVQRTMRDVPVSAAALLARPAPAPVVPAASTAAATTVAPSATDASAAAPAPVAGQ